MKICLILNRYYIIEIDSNINSLFFLSRQHECDYCGMGFYENHELKSHVDSVHQKTKTCKCEICHKPFSDPQMLKTHMYLH